MARTGTVTVVGAGCYGSTTAQRLAEYDLFERVVLTDIKDGWAEDPTFAPGAVVIVVSNPLNEMTTKAPSPWGSARPPVVAEPAAKPMLLQP